MGDKGQEAVASATRETVQHSGSAHLERNLKQVVLLGRGAGGWGHPLQARWGSRMGRIEMQGKQAVWPDVACEHMSCRHSAQHDSSRAWQS